MSRAIAGVLVLGFWGSGALGFSQAGAGQAPRDPAASAQAGKGSIAGMIVVADTSRPIRMARVTVSGSDIRATRTAVTDDQGRFMVTDLLPGSYSITASRPGFLDVVHGQRRPGSGRPGTAVPLAAGQKLDRVTLAMPRGGVITGTVVDDIGETSFGTSVQALRYVMRTGVRTLQVARSATTDDRGIYRIPMLTPGEYLIVATPRDAGAMADEIKARAEVAMAEAAKTSAAEGERMMADVRAMLARGGADAPDPVAGYPPVYHPAAMQVSGASSVTLDIGEERTGVDVRLHLVPLSRVSGLVTADGAIPPGALVSLIDVTQAMPGFGQRMTRVGPDGGFSFSAIPPGQYRVAARVTVGPQGLKAAADRARADAGSRTFAVEAEAAPAETLWAATEITVAGGVVPTVALALQKGMTVSGSVTFDAPAGAPIDLTRLRLTLAPASASPAIGEGLAVRDVAVGADGRFVGRGGAAPPPPRFVIRGAVPGAYRVVPSIGVPPGFLIESAVFAGRDALDVPLEVKPGEDVAGGVVTFSARAAELSGALTDSAGKPAPDYTLVLFSAESRYWLPQSRRIQAARPASDGRFSFRSLPPGDYRLIAVEDVEPGQWFDPGFLKELVAGSMPVTLGKGEKRTQDVRIGR
jgi:hypothetical protein